MLGRGWCRPRLPDSYFGMCYDGVQPWQGRGLSVGALNWHSARREEEQISANRGREFWVKWGSLSSSGIHGPQAIQGPLNPLSEYSSLVPNKRSQMDPSSPGPAIMHPDGFFSGSGCPPSIFTASLLLLRDQRGTFQGQRSHASWQLLVRYKALTKPTEYLRPPEALQGRMDRHKELVSTAVRDHAKAFGLRSWVDFTTFLSLGLFHL